MNYALPLVIVILMAFSCLEVVMGKLLRHSPRLFCSYCLLGSLILTANLALLWQGSDGVANPYGWFMSWRLGATNMFNFQLDH